MTLSQAFRRGVFNAIRKPKRSLLKVRFAYRACAHSCTLLFRHRRGDVSPSRPSQTIISRASLCRLSSKSSLRPKVAGLFLSTFSSLRPYRLIDMDKVLDKFKAYAK